MYCVGLTGNIASGKSTVASFFSQKGITVISADQVARDLTQKHQPAYGTICQRFGADITTASGELNRAKLRQIIFDNPNERLWLENLLHPLIRERIKELLRASKSVYSVVEIPLLKDRSIYPYLDRVLVVLATPEEQIKRVMARDNSSREQAETILKTQPSSFNRQQIADDIILNDSTVKDLEINVDDLHQLYSQLARNG